jgi:hypothetical protein
MARRKLWSNSVSRVERDHRARDARLRLVRIERLLVPRTAMPDFRLSPLIRFRGARAGGNGRRGGRGSGSQSDSRLGCMRETDAAWFGGCGAVCCL